MTLSEYNKVKNYTYKQYCEYLLNKYGPVLYKYGNQKNRPGKEGLFIHHMDENKVSSLCSKENQEIYPQFQEADRLVYANYLEHALLHIMIGEETAGSRNLGLHGANLHIIPGLRSCFENDKINNPKWPAIYYERVRDNKDVFELIFERYNKTVENCDLVIDHNETLYKQVEYNLEHHNKALVVLGTGLGKTTTALQYLWKHQCKGLVLCPNNLIKGRRPEKEDKGSGWEEYGEWVDTITYQAFANCYKTVDYTQYGLIILDEAHHAGYDEDRDQGARVWSQGISYILNKGYKVLGLTATPGRTDNIDVGETLFQGCVCEGMAVEDAIEKHVIHPFSYVTAIYDTEKLVTEVKEKYYSEDEECKKLFGQLDLAINNTSTLKEIFNKYHFQDKKKGIIFIQEIADKEYVMNIFKDICPNKEFRAIDSKMDPTEVEENRAWFEATNEGYLLAVNMISEGAHYKNIDVLVMFRRTESYLVYTQQLGRIITLTKDKNPNAIVFDLVNNVENIKYNDRKLNRKKSEEHTITKIIRALQDLKSEQIIIADETRDIVESIRAIKEYSDLSWSEEEITWLNNNRFNYNYGDLKKLLEDFKQTFPTTKHTESGIKAKIKILGLVNNYAWTEQQLLRLDNEWENTANDVLDIAKRIGKSVDACYAKARERKLSRKGNNKYGGKVSESDKEIISQKYEEMGLKIKSLLSREYADETIIRTAAALGIKAPSRGTKILCVELKKTFNSIHDAADQLHIDRKSISNCCKKKIGYKTAGGYHWEYTEE